MKVVTVATDLDNFNLKNLLIPSCDFFGYELIVLNLLSTWDSHRMKDLALIAYLETLKADEIILFTDAYDTFLLNTPESSLKKWSKYKYSLLFSAEANCWPEQEFASAYNQINHHGKFRFLNSGGYMGSVSTILKVLKTFKTPPSGILRSRYDFSAKFIENCDKRYSWSNQYYWSLIYLSQENSIVLDKNSELFKCFGTPLAYFRKHRKDYLNNGVHSRIYQKELSRIKIELDSLDESTIGHVHFNNPILKHVFKTLLEERLFPDWIINVLSKRVVAQPQIIEID